MTTSKTSTAANRFLLLARHAKSSWTHSGLSDHDRPLNKRGLHDAPMMGERLAAHDLRPELIVSSSAVRALSTATEMAHQLGLAEDRVQVEPRIYGAGPNELLDIVHGLDDGARRVMLVGHNPTLLETVERLANRELGHMPTCAIAFLQVHADTWREVAWGAAELLDFQDPRHADT